MLPARARMRKRRDFEAAVRRGRRTGRRLLVAHLTAADGSDSGTEPATDVAKVGFVVSRAVGNAPTRNLVRRRLRHLATDRLSRLPQRSRLVVRAKPAAASASFAELGGELDVLLDRLGTPSSSASSASSDGSTTR